MPHGVDNKILRTIFDIGKLKICTFNAYIIYVAVTTVSALNNTIADPTLRNCDTTKILIIKLTMAPTKDARSKTLSRLKGIIT